jgi:hypothetical protein
VPASSALTGRPSPTPRILDHLRVIHPDVWGDGPTRWPDGRIVVYDTTLTPGDFGGER